ncbi:MAG: hypothetical protein KDK12_16915 [Rhodobacteraceae bacterium]|nr:hypothetical protein [Paracoccaceae bacterium]
MSRVIVLALIALLAALPAGAQTYLGSYTAFIGGQDLVNSNGQRLWEAWQIIRQDRANVHRFNRVDPGDAGDPWFANANARAALEQVLMQGGIDPASRAMIVQGGVWVQVDVYGWGNQITGARVSAYR